VRLRRLDLQDSFPGLLGIIFGPAHALTGTWSRNKYRGSDLVPWPFAAFRWRNHGVGD
jgi:hypothetical protein